MGQGELLVEDSRMDILRAAAECFMERGYAATSIDDVARRLDATKGRIYHHFHSKGDLFAAVFRTGMDMDYAAVAPFRDRDGPAAGRWLAMARVHTLMMMTTKPFQRAVWIGVEMHLRGATTPEQRSVLAELIDYRTRYGDIFRQELRRARDEGAFHFSDLGVANQVTFMTLNSPIFWYSPRPGETSQDVQALADQVVALAYGGLKEPKEQTE